jgi:predicted GNAT family acetyltransferase
MRASEDNVNSLLLEALVPGRPHTIVTLPALSESIQAAMLVDKQRVNRVYELDVASFRPVINVMVQPGQSALRYEIHTQDRVVAAAGVNWRSAHLAEMYVYTEDGFQGRGWGRAVGAACVRDLLAARVRPLYTASEDNLASLRLAESLGFRDSGAREFECLARLGQS